MEDSPLSAIRGIIFDLDDTLYDKSQWIVPALEYAAQQMGWDAATVREQAIQYIKENRVADASIYNQILIANGQSDTAMNIRALVAWMNQYNPKLDSLKLLPGCRQALEKLMQNYKLAVIAEGPVSSQRARVNALRLSQLVPTIIYSDRVEGAALRRPDPRLIQEALAELDIKANSALFVADNPLRDFKAAKSLSLITVRVLTGEYSYLDYPSADHCAHYDISSVSRLPALIEQSPPSRFQSSSGSSSSTTGDSIPL